MKILVLFDGAGLARQGLEWAGHECVGVENDPIKHELGKYVGRGETILSDVRDLTAEFIESFDAYWFSPPCQAHSISNTNPIVDKEEHFAKSGGDLLKWSLELGRKMGKPYWVENVVTLTDKDSWGTYYNAFQFGSYPKQRRRRIIGGDYLKPLTRVNFQHNYPKDAHLCPPAVLATEYKDMFTSSKKVRRSFTLWYRKHFGRNPVTSECAFAQGFTIPSAWDNPELRHQFNLTEKQMRNKIVEIIGNGVPVYMAQAFGEMYK